MNRPRIHKLFLASAAVLVTGSLALLAGCKGNTSAAAVTERVVTPPPIIQAYPLASGNPLVDPVANSYWANALWLPLVSPANTDRTTAPVSAAVLYDANCLYVAFVSNQPAGNVALDAVSVYLDSSLRSTGADILNVTVSKAGTTTCSWIRDAEPPLKARDDGTPDMFHPISKIPNVAVPGLLTKTSESLQHGIPVWTAVIAIPLKGLPLPLRAAPAAGAKWKLNLLRTTLLPDTGSGVEQLQANLSPIFVGSQAVSPYRMATLTLAPTPPQVSVATAQAGNHS